MITGGTTLHHVWTRIFGTLTNILDCSIVGNTYRMFGVVRQSCEDVILVYGTANMAEVSRKL